MKEILFLSIVISFLLTILILPKWIKKCRDLGMVWEDMNKPNHPKNVAASGGIVVVMAFIIGVLFYVAIRTFLINETDGINVQIFSLLCVILIFSIVGLTDDLLGWKKGGLSKRFRLFLAFFASIPLVVINAGDSIAYVPFIGTINFGILYPLIIIPLGIAGAASAYNFLAGFNGLEAGQGIIIVGFLSFVAYITGSSWLSLVGLIMVGALIGFYFYNKVPAKVFPGDILTWSVGALVATMAILGNFEKIALFIFIPYMIEVVLKCRGKLAKHSFGKTNKDGSLEMPYDKIYGLTHFSIWFLKKVKKKVYENDVVYFIFAIQIIFCLLAIALFL